MAESQDGQEFGDKMLYAIKHSTTLDRIIAFPNIFGENWPTNCLLVLCAWMYMYVCRREADKDRLKCMRH